MKGTRRTQALPDDVAMKMDGFTGQLKRHANTVLTVLLLIAAGYLFYRWRTRSAENERLTIASYIGNAQESLQQLEDGRFAQAPVSDKDPRYDKNNPLQPFPMKPADAIRMAGLKQADVEKYISDALNASSVDEKTKLHALQIRGNLYWTMANLPQMPDAATNPADRYAETPDDYLKKAAEAYNEIVAADPAKYTEQVDGAKLSLAAIAVNKSDWSDAQKQMQAVADDAAAPEFLRTLAKSQLEKLPEWKESAIVLPTTTGPSDLASTGSTTNPATPRGLEKYGPFVTSPGPATQPAIPTTAPAVTGPSMTAPPISAPTTLPTVMPTTIPVGPRSIPATSKPAH